jgi:hypothetical protein
VDGLLESLGVLSRPSIYVTDEEPKSTFKIDDFEVYEDNKDETAGMERC